jgi:two-component system, OmpR family, KDP operon response regulator KdpE
MTSSPPTGRRILACDDETQILRALKLTLRSAGYEVLTTANMQEALDAAALSPVDAAIVDLLLPDGDGIELCGRLREWSEMPIIVLSAVGEEEQKVRALRAGADDYVTKPFGPEELVARLEAVLRRASSEPDDSRVTIAGLELDLAGHVVRRDGEEIHLTRTEFELLRMLVRNRGRLLTHRMLLSEVWGPGYAEDIQVLRTHIARLRAKIEPAHGARRHYIRTEPGVGYRFDPK